MSNGSWIDRMKSWFDAVEGKAGLFAYAAQAQRDRAVMLTQVGECKGAWHYHFYYSCDGQE